MQGLFWMEGALIRGNGTDTVCPKETLCSVGWGEISLLMVSRLTAFMMYVTIMLVFFTKCHSMTHFLARTYVAELIPIEYLHRTHKNQGMLFFVLAVLHTLGHLVRWALRAELSRMLLKTVGMSGIFAMLLMVVIVAPMAAPALKRRLSFELRISLHAGRHVEVLLLALLLLHATRAGVITLILAGVWMLDRLYMLLYRTHRLNTVELTRLHEGGDKDERGCADAVEKSGGLQPHLGRVRAHPVPLARGGRRRVARLLDVHARGDQGGPLHCQARHVASGFHRRRRPGPPSSLCADVDPQIDARVVALDGSPPGSV